jgi:serine/threonine protein kinase
VNPPNARLELSALALEVDALCDDFERHWHRARRRGAAAPDVAGFLARANPASRAVLSRYLLALEQELRAGVLLPDVPGWKLEEEIGRGGMGVVYRAHRLEDGRAVALKLIPGAEHARWLRWLEELADLRHPNLVPLEAFGSHDGLFYVVMPLVTGGDLKEHLAEFSIGPGAGRMELHAVARLMAKVAGAVDFLHRRGILHRDLKPSNILLDSARAGAPLVCDFGLAGRLGEGHEESPGVVGTPAYMAPEQAARGKIGPAADVWSLGAILYELLTGRPPGESLRQPDEVNPAVDEELSRICLGCLGRQASERYLSVAELAGELGYYLGTSDDRPAKSEP